MPLTDLLQRVRPPGITCEKYTAGADGKRCAYYLDDGACVRPDEFMCVEWLRRNAHLPPAPAPDAGRQAAIADLHQIRDRLAAQAGGAR